jgi:glutamate/tyrosine decarboxylase-like PLP-dependent enzyme
MMYEPLLTRAHALARAHLDTLDRDRVTASARYADLLAALAVPLQDDPIDATTVIEELAATVSPGLVATPGPRYFGFVTGGTLPVTVAADWLVSAWDQNAALHVMSPAASAIEEAAARWILDLLALPAGAAVGFVTGATMANMTALAAARHEVLRRTGWDVEAHGLQGAPRVEVFAGAEAHASIFSATRLLGLGSSIVTRVEADDQGRMRPDALARRLAGSSGPRIVCAQVGNVNTGAFDPMDEIADAVRHHDAWLHVDGAFGVWAAASDRLKHHVAGLARADSWATDAHKWLNVPYDSGIVVVAHPAPHRASMSQRAAYLIPADDEQRDGQDWTPEASRRSRAVPVFAALRALGRRGLARLIDGCCERAAQMASRLAGVRGVAVLNEVVLNQVLVRFTSPAGADITRDVIARVQEDGTCWCGGTEWHGAPAMRISISNWRTSTEDIDRAAEAILRAMQP